MKLAQGWFTLLRSHNTKIMREAQLLSSIDH